MEPSRFEAFRPYRDEAIQRIDAYLSGQSHAPSGPVGGEPLGYEPRWGFSSRGPRPWDAVCGWWPAAARKAADVLTEGGETALAKYIYRELDRLPDEAEKWQPFQLRFCHNRTKAGAEQVKAILEKIGPDAAGSAAAGTSEAAADELAGKPQGATAVNAERVGRLLALCGDGRALQILRVAKDQAKSAEERMIALVELDGRFDGFNSVRWGELLDVTPDNIRGTAFWKDRKNRKEWAE